jgi:prepilin signal peptidase PulO-like enzyme (type II secretory pathway)
VVVFYWSVVAFVFGCCIGSFVNVIIYRWPRDLSIRHPKRSFCPVCEHPIAARDNIPLLSYILLRGQCRHCHTRISTQYPLVELATGLAFVLVYDAFFVAQLRLGLTSLQIDWIILVAHWILFAGLIALAVMDLESYMVDIRVTGWVAAAAVLCHMLWTPASSAEWIRPGSTQATLLITAAVGLVIGSLLMLRKPATEEPSFEEVEEVIPPSDQTASNKVRWLLPLLGLLLAAGYVVWMIADNTPSLALRIAQMRALEMQAFHALDRQAISVGWQRPGLLLLVLFAALAALASQPQAEADEQILEAIESEAPSSRRQAWQELQLLLPALILVILVGWTMPDWLRNTVVAACEWELYGGIRPVLGVVTALAGWIIGGALGWLTRIVFTFIFGKEALGMGDVHIMAAAGAVAGWPVVFIGFFLAAPLALLALIVIRLRRQSRALPYGPWLALAFLLVAIYQDYILLYLRVREVLT